MKTISTRNRRAKLAEQNASPRQRAERARRKRMGVGLIQKPLRFIGIRTNQITHDENGNTVVVPSVDYESASLYAQLGNGQAVRNTAYDVLRS